VVVVCVGTVVYVAILTDTSLPAIAWVTGFLLIFALLVLRTRGGPHAKR
jgi:hypothetical protein